MRRSPSPHACLQTRAVYYCVSPQYGEAWTAGSWLELGGMCLLLVGTAVYNGSLVIPGLSDPADLLGTSSAMSSPALSRSPQITQNRAGITLEGGRSSPYVQRVQMGGAGGGGGGGAGGGMMYVSVSGDKREALLPR